MSTYKLEREFKRIRIALMRHEKFVDLGPMMMLGTRTLTTDVPTAATNGRDEFYNPEFVFKWGPKGTGFLCVHETWHKAGRHLQIYAPLKKLDAGLANKAMDYWINQTIIEADPDEEIVAMPRDDNGDPIGLLDVMFKGYTIKQIFDELYKKKQEEEEEEEKEGGGEGAGEGGEGGEEGEGDGEGTGFDEHDWDGAKEMSEEEQGALRQDVESAIRQGLMAAKKMGKGSGSNALGLGELLAPQVDWLEQLKYFIRASFSKARGSSFRRLNRRYLSMGLFLPVPRGQALKELVCAIDVSGSMFFDNSFEVCMSELEGLATQLAIDKIHLIYWDGWVCAHEQYTASNFKNWRTLTKPTGGGGTNPKCVSDYIRKEKLKPDAVVMLTDGIVPEWGTWDTPVLWGIHNRENIVAPVGKTIRLERRV